MFIKVGWEKIYTYRPISWFLGNLHIDFHSGWMVSHSHKQCIAPFCGKRHSEGEHIGLQTPQGH